MGRIRTALKWFAYGIGLGLLFAPRSGQETRRQVVDTVSGYLSGALNRGGRTLDQAATETEQAGDRTSARMQQYSDDLDRASYDVRESSTTSGSSAMGGGPA